MQQELTNSKVLLAFFDYKFLYQEPVFDLWEKRNAVAQALFRAFRPWAITPEQIVRTRNPSDSGESLVSAELLNKRVLFNVGLPSSGMSVSNPFWEEQSQLLAIASAGIEAVRSSLAVSPSRQWITLAIHLQPQGKSILDIASNFVRPTAIFAGQETPTAFGFSVYSETAVWVVDRSALYSDSLFIRLTHSFPPDQPLVELANTMCSEQERMLDILKLRIE